MNLQPISLAEAERFLDPDDLSRATRDSLKLFTGHINRADFLQLVFIEPENEPRYVTCEGRSLAQVVSRIRKAYYPLEKLWALNSWFQDVRCIYENSFNYNKMYSFLRPTTIGEHENSNGGSWYLEGGNHRALALALKLELDDFVFQDVKVVVFYE